MPSFPLIPTPMLASIIIGTSLAPSPIDKDIDFFLYLASFTTNAFCLGETLHQTTDLAWMAKVKNRNSSSWLPKIRPKVGPSITTLRLGIIYLAAFSDT